MFAGGSEFAGPEGAPVRVRPRPPLLLQAASAGLDSVPVNGPTHRTGISKPGQDFPPGQPEVDMKRILFDVSRWHLLLHREHRQMPRAHDRDAPVVRLEDELFERLYTGEGSPSRPSA